MSSPPLKNISLLLNSTSLNLGPVTGSKKQFLPLPPLKVTDNTLETSNSWGSTNISFTLPLIIGSTLAVVPMPTTPSTTTFGGLTISYPVPVLYTSVSSIVP